MRFLKGVETKLRQAQAIITENVKIYKPQKAVSSGWLRVTPFPYRPEITKHRAHTNTQTVKPIDK